MSISVLNGALAGLFLGALVAVGSGISDGDLSAHELAAVEEEMKAHEKTDSDIADDADAKAFEALIPGEYADPEPDDPG